MYKVHIGHGMDNIIKNSFDACKNNRNVKKVELIYKQKRPILTRTRFSYWILISVGCPMMWAIEVVCIESKEASY